MKSYRSTLELSYSHKLLDVFSFALMNIYSTNIVYNHTLWTKWLFKI